VSDRSAIQTGFFESDSVKGVHAGAGESVLVDIQAIILCGGKNWSCGVLRNSKVQVV
jgi:hypothetical protein